MENTGRVKKEYKLPWSARSILKKKAKEDTVVVQYLTKEYDIKFKECKVIGGNVIVVNNKAHVLNPKKVWNFGRKRAYIIREIDRQPVSNEDYDEVRERKDDTESDVPLIKAVLGAIHKPSPLANKNIWIMLGIFAAIGIILYFVFTR